MNKIIYGFLVSLAVLLFGISIGINLDKLYPDKYTYSSHHYWIGILSNTSQLLLVIVFSYSYLTKENDRKFN